MAYIATVPQIHGRFSERAPSQSRMPRFFSCVQQNAICRNKRAETTFFAILILPRFVGGEPVTRRRFAQLVSLMGKLHCDVTRVIYKVALLKWKVKRASFKECKKAKAFWPVMLTAARGRLTVVFRQDN